jgi:Protein of unknown function (DUF3363)
LTYSIISGGGHLAPPLAYDLSLGGDELRVGPLSALNLDQQIGSDGATWLDRELTTRDRSEIRDSGFGREVNKEMSRRAQKLVEMGLATAKDSDIHIRVSTVATLERLESRALRAVDRERTWIDVLFYDSRQPRQSVAILPSSTMASASSSSPGTQPSTPA